MAPPTGFGSTVDADGALGHQQPSIGAGVDQVGQLQELTQADHLVGDRYIAHAIIILDAGMLVDPNGEKILITMGTIAITGSAGGIGIATRHLLESDGHRVIGVDVRDAEVIADLSTDVGRQAMVDEVTRAANGVLDGVVAGAGIAEGDGDAVVSTNYFGAVATLAGLRSLLERGSSPSVVAIGSNSCSTQPGLPVDVVEACLADDESTAREAAARNAIASYGASKLALARWVRRAAVTPEWVGAGVRLNAIAPGPIHTPMTADSMEFILNIPDVFPVPQQRAGQPEDVAGLLGYLLSSQASFFCGSVVYMDGGTDAALRGDEWPASLSPGT